MGYVRVIIAAAACTFALGAFPAPASAQLLPCGLLNPCPPPPPPPPPPLPPGPSGSHSLRLTVEPQRVFVGNLLDQEVELEGFYSVGGGTSFPPPVPYEIYQRTWPYTHATLVARSEAFGGFFAARVSWAGNTQYIARVDVDPDPAVARWVTSAPVKLTAFPKLVKFDVDAVKYRVARMEFAYRFPPGPTTRLSGRKIHWYLIRKKGKRRQIKQVAGSRTRMTRGRILKGRVRARLPKGSYRFGGGFCIDLPRNVDLGVGEPVRTRCP